ncbi:unnamed protein product [Orchesella dallaii]|uniref:Uncharacterized protein n=1 Tax=Orchesella dallaii TaxID=48710 RepID=A0ABP1QZ86_9HEXA
MNRGIVVVTILVMLLCGSIGAQMEEHTEEIDNVTVTTTKPTEIPLDLLPKVEVFDGKKFFCNASNPIPWPADLVWIPSMSVPDRKRFKKENLLGTLTSSSTRRMMFCS